MARHGRVVLVGRRAAMLRAVQPTDDPIVVVPYDPSWPLAFERLAARARDALGVIVDRVEHVGSTAVPGLAAKPIVDVDVVLRDAEDLERAVRALAVLGYEHRGELGVDGRHAFAWPAHEPRHHLYVCVPGSAGLQDHLAFRDALRANRALAARYAALKQELAARFAHDRERYVEGKTAFVRDVLRRCALPARRDVPFHANPDGTHCFQATLRMMLGCFFPERAFTWAELDAATAKQEGLWTWPMAGAVWLGELGLDVRVVEPFDYERFAREGEAYVLAYFGDEVGRRAVARTHIAEEIRHAEALVTRGQVARRVPSLEEVRALLDDGWLVGCNVNGRMLHDEPGWSGHFVVVTGHDPDGLTIHDPGPPPAADRRVEDALFDRAWSYPDERARNVLAVRRR